MLLNLNSMDTTIEFGFQSSFTTGWLLFTDKFYCSIILILSPVYLSAIQSGMHIATYVHVHSYMCSMYSFSYLWYLTFHFQQDPVPSILF